MENIKIVARLAMNRAYQIAVDGTTTEVLPANGKDFKLEELYALTDCTTVEIIPLSDGRLMVLDENGKIYDKPQNLLASAIAWGSIRDDDYIVGNVLVCRHDQVL